MNHSSSQKTPVPKTGVVLVVLGILMASIAVNAFLMMMTTTLAYAAPSKEKEIERVEGTIGSAEWDDIHLEVPGVVGTVVYAELIVLESKAGTTDIAVRLFIEDPNNPEGLRNFAEGFTTTNQNVFDADNRLTAATLSPVRMEVVIFQDLFSDVVIGTAEITIQATWEGIGDLEKENIREEIRFEKFSIKFRNSDRFREATAEGSINDANLGTADIAELRFFKGAIMTVSPTIIS